MSVLVREACLVYNAVKKWYFSSKLWFQCLDTLKKYKSNIAAFSQMKNFMEYCLVLCVSLVDCCPCYLCTSCTRVESVCFSIRLLCDFLFFLPVVRRIFPLLLPIWGKQLSARRKLDLTPTLPPHARSICALFPVGGNN